MDSECLVRAREKSELVSLERQADKAGRPQVVRVLQRMRAGLDDAAPSKGCRCGYCVDVREVRHG